MELDLGLLADNAHADAGGKLYILGEFRYILAQQVPATHPRLMIVMRLVADAVEVRDRSVDVQLEVVDADGRPVTPRSPPVPVGFAPIGPAQRGRVMCQIIVEMNALTLPSYGDYSIHVVVDGRHVGRIPFHVLQPPAQPAKPAQRS